MSLSLQKALTIAQREYLTTVRRKAFLFTLVGTPAIYAILMTLMIKPQMSERVHQMRNFRVLGVVDSSGAFADGEPEIRGAVATDLSIVGPQAKSEAYRIEVRMLPDQAAAERALRAHEISQLLVIPADYLGNGRLRRYATGTNIFSSVDERAVSGWLVRSLLRGRVDSLRIDRVARPARGMTLYTLNNDGVFEPHDERRELFDFLLPFAFGMLMGLSIIIGGQYLLQGVAEEKESRILESMLCTVNAEELLAGKLLGLGAAGLTIVTTWIALGAALGGPALAMAQVHVSPAMLGLAVLYFLLGYLFYGGIMTGIGAITNNMREAQQFSFLFTFMNFIPFYMMTSILGRPDSGLAVGLSMFPPMAPVTMVLRMNAPSAVIPAWQIALSLGLMAGTAWLALIGSARLFRIGLLMYGKTPTLPEILRWVRQS
ncbi:MAG TPA: ABC transporter permease [Candidatus Eisenbacteria bacterium]|jgi:ABC-2 type transport system permease protein